MPPQVGSWTLATTSSTDRAASRISARTTVPERAEPVLTSCCTRSSSELSPGHPWLGTDETTSSHRRPRSPAVTDSHDRPDDSEEPGLPPELEQVLRGLTGGAELDPQMVEMMRTMGLDDVDPQ